jgi:hypothetical protein
MFHHKRSPRAARFAASCFGLALGMSVTMPVLAQTVPTQMAPAGDAAAAGHPAAAPGPAKGPGASGNDPMSTASLQTRIGRDKATRIESHISHLHATLRITAAQEPLWQSFASVMRQNVVQMDAVYARRQSDYGSMNAVQDLESYGDVEETNARNVQLLLPPFRALYDSFSPDQKKTADTTFLRYTDKAVKKPG